MDKKIIGLLKDGQTNELQELLTTLPQDEIVSMIDGRAIRGHGDPVSLIRALIQGSPCEPADGLSRRMLVYKHCLKLLRESELHTKTASEIVGFLMMEADAFPAASLAELAALYIDAIKTGSPANAKWLELFPKILSSLAAQDTVSYGGNQMSGTEYKSHVLNSLCSSKWNPENILHLVPMFRDISLSSDELKFVMNKVMRLLRDLDLQELPPLVYQLLLLSTKGHKKIVLEGITSFFSDLDKSFKKKDHEQESCDLVEESCTSPDQLRHVQGTIILHFTFAIKQDQDLGREFVKYLKAGQQNNPGKLLSPFNVALALSIARIHRFEDQIFDFLKSAVLRSYKDSERQEESFWVKEVAPSMFRVEDVMIDTVNNSVFGWDHVTQGLVQIGFLLMDVFGPKGAFGRVTESSPSLTQTPNQKACKLGSHILLRTFKVHEVVRAEILEQIINRVVTKATAPVSHYLELLSDTVQSAPQIILDCLPKVKEAFDYLSFLPPATAMGLLRAVQPLMKISMTLKDSLMLVLRKAMFSRQLEARKVSVSGYLMILRHFHVMGGVPCSQNSLPFTSSQVSVEIHGAHNPASNEALCLEILGNVRRCLSQQADVRLRLYEGFFDVIQRNTKLCSPILGILHSQFMKYYESSEDVTPPLKLEPCISAQGDQVYLAEPLAHLLSCIEQCLSKASDLDNQDEDEVDDSERREFEQIMTSLTRRMIKCDMEDFELDKSADFSTGNSVGVKNNIFAILVMGIYEVLIEHTFCPQDIDQDMCEQVISLHKNYQKLADILKEKNGAPGGKKAQSASNKTARSLLSIQAVMAFLKTLFHDSTPSHQDSITILRQSTDFVKYIVSVANQKVQQVSERGSCDGAQGQSSEVLFKCCCTMAKVLMKHYSTELHSGDDSNKARGKSVTLMCLETLGTIVHVISTRYTNRLQEFLSAIDANRDSGAGGDRDAEQETVHMHIKKFQRLVVTIIGENNEDHRLKEAVVLLNTIGTLSKQLSPEQQPFAQVQSWLHRLCTEQNPEDAGLTKVLLSLLFSLTSQQKACVTLIRDLSQDVHSQLGDIDQDVEVEDRTHFALITHKMAAPTVLSLVLSQMDRELDDTEWVINRMKGEAVCQDVAAHADSSSQGLTQKEAQDKSVCVRLGVLVTSVHELVQSAVPPGVCVENLLKSVAHLYAVLTSLAKYYLSLYSQRLGHMSARFEKLVKLSGTHLTSYVYSMITYVQASQNEQLQRQVEKAGKKDKKKSVAPVGKNTVMKETRFIPNLIFAIEQYERYLIQLSKKSKINLMEHMRLSTSRDFRINTAQLQAALDEQGSSSEEEEICLQATVKIWNKLKRVKPKIQDLMRSQEIKGSSSDEENQSGIENTAPLSKKSKLSSSKSHESKGQDKKAKPKT